LSPSRTDHSLQGRLSTPNRNSTKTTARYLFFFFSFLLQYSALGLIARRAFISAFPCTLSAQRANTHNLRVKLKNHDLFPITLSSFPFLPASPIPKDPSTYPFISFRTCPWSTSFSCSLQLSTVSPCRELLDGWQIFGYTPEGWILMLMYGARRSRKIFFSTEMHNDILGPFALSFLSPPSHFLPPMYN
jgi:hypothetical protein